MKKYILTIPFLMTIIILSGCQNKDLNKNQTPPSYIPETQKINKTVTNNQADDLSLYSNKTMGISFAYPKAWGDIIENKYKNNKALSIKFTQASPELSSDLENNFNFRDCQDILSNGYYSGDLIPDKCDTLIVDGKDITISTYKPNLSPKNYGNTKGRKSAQILTKNGLYYFNSDEEHYDDFIKVIKSIKFND